MSTAPPQPKLPFPNHWPLIFYVLTALGVPSAAALAFGNTLSKKPWQAFTLVLLYEMALGTLAFIRKVRLRLEEEWSQGTATWANKLVTQRWFSYRRYYARFMIFQHWNVDLQGLSTQSICTLEVEQDFVDLRLDPKPVHLASSNPIPAGVPQELRAGQHAPRRYLAATSLKHQHLVILGAPGSGMTTFLKHLAITLVSHQYRRTLDLRSRRRLGTADCTHL